MYNRYLCATFLLMFFSSQGIAQLPESQSSRAGHFIGCAPTIAECKNSCAGRDGFGWQDSQLCHDRKLGIACHCPIFSDEKPADPDPTEYRLIGCVPSPSECRYSCGISAAFIAQESNQCDSLSLGCFCRIAD